ncbi:MAG: ABC transporter ATP-binding protein [Verrucomicrobia bacterium]|nr:ABC transporter ATP-binding protein [Verrucomicrobiota bacterium]
MSVAAYRSLAPYAFRQWRRLLTIGVLTLLSSLAVALQPWPMKVLVDYALSGIPVPDAVGGALARFGIEVGPVVLIVGAGAASLGIFALNSLLDVGLTWSWAVAGQRMVRELAGDVFGRLQRRSFRYHQQQPVGDSLDRLTSDTWCVYQMTDGLLISPAQQLIMLGALGVVAWQLNAELAVYSLLTAPLMAWATVKFGNPLKRRARLAREARARLVSFVHQTLSSIPVVQAFATEHRNWDRFHALAADSVAVSQRGALVTSHYTLVTGLIAVSGTALIVYVGGRQVLAGALTIGGFMVFLAYLRTLQGAAEGLIKLYGALKPVEASIDRVLEVLRSGEDEVVERTGAIARVASAAGPRGAIRFEQVTFGYVPGRPAVESVTFEVRPGETVALVGATGAGKSTLASLVARFYDPWSGRITLDGHDLRDVRLAELRAQIALVFQESFLLPLSVAENIAYGRPEATREEVVAVARAANADEFIRRLPEGYDTVLGERGATLSGGERQRIAIARAMLKDAAVLILDEPTSALDGWSEAPILEAVEVLRAGRTTLIIAHRHSTVRQADRVLVLEQGRVVEEGTPAQLLARGGTYARSMGLQESRSQLPAEVAA